MNQLYKEWWNTFESYGGWCHKTGLKKVENVLAIANN